MADFDQSRRGRVWWAGAACGAALERFPGVQTKTPSSAGGKERYDLDINAVRIADGKATVAEIEQEIFDLLLRAASGERVAAERNGHREFVPWRIGPVM
ncbi:MAG: UxaA family hydrolase [Bryobacteraceae bacterium]|nr:UxaA family hydrolase [Bryobacteraceae bacterium]